MHKSFTNPIWENQYIIANVPKRRESNLCVFNRLLRRGTPETSGKQSA